MEKPPNGDEPKTGKLISFPDGNVVNTDEIGVDNFVVGTAGSIPLAELVDQTKIDKDFRDRDTFIKSQELMQAVEKKASTSEWIDIVLQEIAEESTNLKYERRKAAKEGNNTANFTVMRVGTLRQLAEVLMKRKDISSSEKLDLKSERFQKVFKMWMEFFYHSMMKSGVEETIIDLVFQQMKADMVDWEKRFLESE